jgi:hypothetical protein
MVSSEALRSCNGYGPPRAGSAASTSQRRFAKLQLDGLERHSELVDGVGRYGMAVRAECSRWRPRHRPRSCRGAAVRPAQYLRELTDGLGACVLTTTASSARSTPSQKLIPIGTPRRVDYGLESPDSFRWLSAFGPRGDASPAPGYECVDSQGRSARGRCRGELCRAQA